MHDSFFTKNTSQGCRKLIFTIYTSQGFRKLIFTINTSQGYRKLIFTIITSQGCKKCHLTTIHPRDVVSLFSKFIHHRDVREGNFNSNTIQYQTEYQGCHRDLIFTILTSQVFSKSHKCHLTAIHPRDVVSLSSQLIQQYIPGMS